MTDDWKWLQESQDWPKSYNTYTGQITFQVAAHSEEQARQRLESFEQFLSGLVLDSHGNGPHPSMRFVTPNYCATGRTGPYNIQFSERTEYESAHELRPSILADSIPEWTWLRPDAEDIDPEELAREVHVGAGEAADEMYERIVEELAERGITYPFPRTTQDESPQK